MASDFLPPPNWPTLQATLTEICLCLTEAVPSVESAGVVIFPPESPPPGQRPTLERAEVIGAAPAGAAVLQIERQLDEGPVLTACISQSIVTSGDLSTDERWRRFGHAVAELQLHSAVAVPLPGISSVTAGVLSLYSHHRDAFDVRTIHLIAALADVVRIAMLGAEMLEQNKTIIRGDARGLGPIADRQPGGGCPHPLELHRGAGASSTVADGQPRQRRSRSISSGDRRGGQRGSPPEFHLLAELLTQLAALATLSAISVGPDPRVAPFTVPGTPLVFGFSDRPGS